MFCPEERIARELYWAGFGFQVWCQMLTFMVKSRDTVIFIIDEPDIYLHSDLQRQLLSILKTLGPDILIATHSTEMISEVDPDDLLVINKTFKSAKRIKDPRQIQDIFHVLGSNLNPTLTQLAKSKRVLFVEGKDFQLIAQFARKLKKNQIANRSDFAVVPAEGFNPQKVHEFTKGIEATLGISISSGVLFDRDYRSEDEVNDILTELKNFTTFSHILDRKEIENYLLEQTPLKRAIERRLEEKRIRTGKSIQFVEDMATILEKVTAPFKHKVVAQYMTRREQYEKAKKTNLDPTTIKQKIMIELDELWDKLSDRVRIVPGKEVFASLNQYLQQQYKVTISPTLVIESFHAHDIPSEIVVIIDHLDQLRKQNTGNDV
jgi:predicted ATP-dependent endonuclease of OLD family